MARNILTVNRAPGDRESVAPLDTRHHARDNPDRNVMAAWGRRSAGVIARIRTRVAV